MARDRVDHSLLSFAFHGHSQSLSLPTAHLFISAVQGYLEIRYEGRGEGGSKEGGRREDTKNCFMNSQNFPNPPNVPAVQ